MRWVMQYRTRLTEDSEWGEWNNLAKALTFSSYYAPLYFEFRAHPIKGIRAFVFSGSVIDEDSFLQ